MHQRYTPESKTRHSRRPTIKRQTSPTSPWMVSFGDLITLLFCLFLTLNASGVFTITPPLNPNSPSGPTFAASNGGAMSSSKNRHTPIELYLTEEALADIATLRSRIEDMISSHAESFTISTHSCRPPGSKALAVDFSHIKAATDTFSMRRIFGLQNTPCAKVGDKPSVVKVSVLPQSIDRLLDTNKEGQIR